MPTRLIGAVVRWLMALKGSPSPAVPCATCAARAEILSAKDAELTRYLAREAAQASQIIDLQNKMAALADMRAAAVAARITAEAGTGGPRPRVPRPRSLTVPAFANQLIGTGAIDIGKVRDIASKRRMAQAAASGGLPPVID